PSTRSVPEERREYWRRAQHAVYDASKGRKYVRDSLGDIRSWNVGNGASWQEPVEEDPPEDVWGVDFEAWVAALTEGRGDDAAADVDDATQRRLKELGYL
ncbi:hypothetical protein ACFQE1_17010, partial [Halobium palmae]